LAALLALAALVSASGCASPWKRASVYARDGVFLYREHEEVEGQRRPKSFAHPVDLPAGKAEALLRRLVYVRKPWFEDPVKTYVFTPDEAQRLSAPLASALKAIGPDERLRFLTTRGAWTDFLTGASGNSGVIFRTQDGALNLVFDAIDQGVDSGEGGKPEEVSFPHEPTEYRDEPPLVEFPGAKLHVDPRAGKIHPRWLELDLAALEEPAPPAQPVPAAGSSGALPPGQPGLPPASRTPEEEARYQELRQKLETLKRLKSDGAISEEEYRVKYDELMKGL
jgi:hypothetical protein